MLEATTEAVTPEATVLDQTVFAVRPQPGKPQSLVDRDGPPEDDRWEWWNSFHTYYGPAHQARAVWVTNCNAYTLVDKFGNTVWGYRDTRAMHGGNRLTVNLPDQETTAPDFRAYALEMKWWADGSDQMPEGVTSVGLFVSYPESPGEWAAGEVSKSTLIDLQGGSQTHLKSYGGYEARFGMDDGAFPMSVSPAAGPEAIPKVGPGPAWATPRNLDSPRRLALVLLTGREAPSLQEVFRAPHHPWEWTGGTWVERPVQPAQDPRIDVASTPKLRMKLVDVNGNVQTAAGFKVHFCPRFDHEGSPQAPAWTCPTPRRESTNGVIDGLDMNPGVVGNGDPPAPDATGYLGLELTQAPTAPGTYYVYVESLDKDVKVRDQTLLHLDDTPEGQFQGGFALCTVTGAEILDQNFQRTEPIDVSQPTTAYVRVTDSSHAGATYDLTLGTERRNGTILTAATPMTLTRVGASSVFLSSLTLLPEEYPVTPRRTGLVAGSPSATVPLGAGKAVATLPNSAEVRRGTKFPGAVRLRFLRRDVHETCFGLPFPADSECPVTAAPDESTAPGTVQETAIKVTYLANGQLYEACPSGQTCIRNHMEVVALVADVVSPWDVKAKKLSPAVDAEAKGTLKFLEIPNSTYLDNEAASQPARFFRRFFSDSGIPRSGQDLTDALRGSGTLDLTNGRATFRLNSLAPQRYDANGSHPIVWTQTSVLPASHLSYTTTLKVGLDAVPSSDVNNPDDGIALTINQWVDERTYARTRANKDSGAPAWTDQPNQSTDWLEARAMDLLADADIGPNPEANEVLMRPTRVLEGWAPPSNAPNAVGWVSSSDPTTITLKPSAWSRRFDIGVGVPGPWTYRGLANAVTKYSDLFPALMFHEARHSWQYLLSRNGFTDADGDFLVQNPPVSSPEIADAPYPTNPDFSFLGDAGGSGSNDLVLQPAMRRESVEHNADRFAMRQLGGLLTCASAYCLAAAVDSANGAMVVTGTYQGEGSAEQGQQKLNGRLVKIETASTCGSTSWTPLPNNFTNCFGTGRPCATDSEGRLTIPSLPGGQSYRFTLINPAECSAQEVSTCVAIP